jgi:hypothetical protein
MAKTPTMVAQIRNAIHADAITARKKDGTVILRKGFFYRMGGNATAFADRVARELVENDIPGTVIDSGERWKPFRGGASIMSQSHWWVIVKEKERVNA